MNTYEVSWQFEQGDLEWADSFLYYAENIETLGQILRSIKNSNTNWNDKYNDDDDLDADDRDITDELPEDLLAE